MTATMTQHNRHAAACPCGRVHVAARPDGVADTTVSYGPNLVAWCVYLMVAHAIPVARCAELVAALTGTRPSDGFVHGLIGRVAAAVAPTNQIIRALITGAHAVSADETPIRVGAARVKKYLLGHRSLETFKAFVLPDLTGVVVHDRYQNYDAKLFAHLVHQLCVAALQALVHQANLARDKGLAAIEAHIADPLIGIYRHGVRVGLKEVPRIPGADPPKHRARLEALRDREADILRFTTDLRIPPTSSQAERDLRPAKTQQKISWRLTSETVTAGRYAIRGYISTVAKHGTDIMTAIRDAIRGRPWAPPAFDTG